jgi:hypothetical protein
MEVTSSMETWSRTRCGRHVALYCHTRRASVQLQCSVQTEWDGTRAKLRLIDRGPLGRSTPVPRYWLQQRTQISLPFPALRFLSSHHACWNSRHALMLPTRPPRSIHSCRCVLRILCRAGRTPFFSIHFSFQPNLRGGLDGPGTLCCAVLSFYHWLLTTCLLFRWYVFGLVINMMSLYTMCVWHVFCMWMQHVIYPMVVEEEKKDHIHD